MCLANHVGPSGEQTLDRRGSDCRRGMGAQPIWMPETSRVISNVKHVLDTKGQTLEQTAGCPLQRHMGVTAEGPERVMQVCRVVPGGHAPSSSLPLVSPYASSYGRCSSADRRVEVGRPPLKAYRRGATSAPRLLPLRAYTLTPPAP